MTAITITRALAELKVLSKRIDRAITDLDLCRVGAETLQSPALQEQRASFVTNAKAGLQAANDLIHRRDVIKAAIVASNAATLVTIGGEQMPVAAAIEKKTSIAHYEALLSKLRRIRSEAIGTLERETSSYEERLDRFLGAQASALGKSKTDAAWVEEMTASFARLNKPVIVNPCDLDKKISSLQEYIETFNMEVDFVLSESNARTTIDV